MFNYITKKYRRLQRECRRLLFFLRRSRSRIDNSNNSIQYAGFSKIFLNSTIDVLYSFNTIVYPRLPVYYPLHKAISLVPSLFVSVSSAYLFASCGDTSRRTDTLKIDGGGEFFSFFFPHLLFFYNIIRSYRVVFALSTPALIRTTTKARHNNIKLSSRKIKT